MARHLGDLSAEEYDTLRATLTAWLEQHDVAGSLAHDYNLYDAIDDQRLLAFRAVEKARRGERRRLRQQGRL